ncbi:MAG: hypothetical protein IVW53_15325 [Chloroflexi bacterium]|nr:hypothetical protein [Chloroflexota bacterium]
MGDKVGVGAGVFVATGGGEFGAVSVAAMMAGPDPGSCVAAGIVPGAPVTLGVGNDPRRTPSRGDGVGVRPAVADGRSERPEPVPPSALPVCEETGLGVPVASVKASGRPSDQPTATPTFVPPIGVWSAVGWIAPARMATNGSAIVVTRIIADAVTIQPNRGSPGRDEDAALEVGVVDCRAVGGSDL